MGWCISSYLYVEILSLLPKNMCYIKSFIVNTFWRLKMFIDIYFKCIVQVNCVGQWVRVSVRVQNTLRIHVLIYAWSIYNRLWAWFKIYSTPCMTPVDIDYTRFVCIIEPWRRNDVKSSSASLALCAGNPLVTDSPHKVPVMHSFNVIFDVKMNRQSSGTWFEMT